MAALTGAIAASSLGIAGTIIGAAVMSLASTVGAAVYKHYLARSNERLRAAATGLAPKASGHPVAAVLRRHLRPDPDETARPDGQAVMETGSEAPSRAADRTAPPGRRAPRTGRPDSADARVRPALAAAARPGRHARPDGTAKSATGTGTAAAFTREDAVAAAVAADIAAAVLGDRSPLGHASPGYTAAEHPAAGQAAGQAGDGTGTAGLRPTADLAEAAGLRPAPGLGDAADLHRTARLRPATGPGPSGAGPARAQPGDATAPDEPAGPGGGPAAGDWSRRPPRRPWLVLAGAVLGVFVVAMGAVTAVEAIAGKPLETLIWHRAGSGTTIGSAVSHRARHHPAPVPSTSPPASRSSSAPAGRTSPGAVSPTAAPTPTASVAPSTGAPAGAGSGTEPGTGTSAGTGARAAGAAPAPGQ
jgi:hypothetical protein